jgi:TonB family protein
MSLGLAFLSRLRNVYGVKPATTMTRRSICCSAVRGGLGLLAVPFLFCSCAASRMAFEGNPMPHEQVNSFLQIVSAKGSYDVAPTFRKGYAPFFPESESKTRHLGYAMAEFTITAEGKPTGIRVLKATSLGFAEEAAYALQDWRFTPAQKNGQPVAVRARLPFTFRQT